MLANCIMLLCLSDSTYCNNSKPFHHLSGSHIEHFFCMVRIRRWVLRKACLITCTVFSSFGSVFPGSWPRQIADWVMLCSLLLFPNFPTWCLVTCLSGWRWIRAKNLMFGNTLVPCYAHHIWKWWSYHPFNEPITLSSQTHTLRYTLRHKFSKLRKRFNTTYLYTQLTDHIKKERATTMDKMYQNKFMDILI